jgi:cellobiose transport system substrate-binding protein
MSSLRRPVLRKVVAAGAAVALFAAAGCGGSNEDASGADGTITLTVKTFSQFGYEDLYKQYEASHPGIKIKQDNIAQLDDYTPKLQQWLTAGSGAGDVVALEEGILVKLMAKPDQVFVLFGRQLISGIMDGAVRS